jgi:hypothetical protein
VCGAASGVNSSMPLYLDDGCGGIIRFIRWSNTARPLRCTKRCVLPPLDAAIFNFNKAYSTLCHRECCDASCQCANITTKKSPYRGSGPILPARW